MNQLATTQEQRAPAAKRERIEVMDAVPLLDTSRFEHMQRVATVMARSTLMPDSLWQEGTKDKKTPLPYEQILSNCFLVVNQAVRWGLDPFAVAQCVSVVHGKLCYEGKLVAAVLDAKMAIKLHHHFVGDGEAMRVYLSDQPFTDEIVALLRPNYRRQDMRIFDGSVADWKTTGAGTPWTPKNFVRMLIYRGTRDWCRLYEPALMLGVYTPDEMGEMEETARMRNARNITPNVIDDPLSDLPLTITRQDTSENAHSATQEDGDARSASVDTSAAEVEHDALTGEILDNTNTGEDIPASPVDDAGSAPALEGDGIAAQSSSPSSAQVQLTTLDRSLLIECFAKFMDLTVREDLDAKGKRGALEAAKNAWKVELRQELHPNLAGMFLSADAIITGKQPNRLSVIKEYAHFLDCSIEEIGG